MIEEEVETGIQRFKVECDRLKPGLSIVVPSRPTGGAFLVSLTYEGHRTYITIAEDDFADWGENESDTSLKSVAQSAIKKLENRP